MMLNQHSLEMRLNLPTTQLELFDDVGNFFETMCITMWNAGCVCDHKKGGTFEQHNFVCTTDCAVFVQV